MAKYLVTYKRTVEELMASYWFGDTIEDAQNRAQEVMEFGHWTDANGDIQSPPYQTGWFEVADDFIPSHQYNNDDPNDPYIEPATEPTPAGG